MRHRITQLKLNRTSSHRKALRRNLAQSLFEHGQVRTTLPKAKDLRPFAERLITLAKRAHQGNLSARRRIHVLMGDRSSIPQDHRETYEAMSDAKRAKAIMARSGRRHRTGMPKGKMAFTAERITHRLINTIAPRYADRPGGYTRLIRLSDRRLGDQAALAMLQLVGDEDAPTGITRPLKTARKKRADGRYAFAVKALKAAGRKKRPGPAKTGPRPEQADHEAHNDTGEPKGEES